MSTSVLQIIRDNLSTPIITSNEMAVIIFSWCLFGIVYDFMFKSKPDVIRKLAGIKPIPTAIYLAMVLCITVPKAFYDYTDKAESPVYCVLNCVNILLFIYLLVYLLKYIIIMQRKRYDYVFFSEEEKKFYVIDSSNMMEFLQSVLDGMDIERESNKLLSVMITFIHIFKEPAKYSLVPFGDIKNVITMLKASCSAYENEVIEVEDTDEKECVIFQKYVYLNFLVKLLEENLKNNQPLVCVRVRNLRKVPRTLRIFRLSSGNPR